MKKSFFPLILVVVLVVVLLSGCGAWRDARHYMKYGPERPVDRLVSAHEPGQISFREEIQPILNRRCAACHGCYDAPCQLKLTCSEGLERGGSKVMIYDATRLLPVKPTRLFIDAKTVEGWRELGFHPVINERDQTEEAHLENSVLNLMLQLKKEHPLPQKTPLPNDFDLDLERKQTCASAAEFDEYKKKYPLWGMPYALPGLTDEERKTMVAWIRQGAKIMRPPVMSKRAQRIVDEWETFFNGESLKNQLASRYIYEHLFIAHIHFDSLPDREFYRLVRSGTPPGEPVDEINTVRPYDDPGVEKFYYRLRRVESTIVVKNHTVYHMNPGKMDRYKELFLEQEYEVAELPSYEVKIASNPFKSFKDLPALSRYRFLLDDAQFIVMGFIKGPVCRGQIALNVVNDHFFVSFFDPEKDVISNDTAFLARVSDHLSMPSEQENNIRFMSVW
ncbi:MAG: isomerase, partial [Desulfobacterales bacterium]|nr:isomerase [Desulfobacterales bacterium]